MFSRRQSWAASDSRESCTSDMLPPINQNFLPLCDTFCVHDSYPNEGHVKLFRKKKKFPLKSLLALLVLVTLLGMGTHRTKDGFNYKKLPLPNHSLREQEGPGTGQEHAQWTWRASMCLKPLGFGGVFLIWALGLITPVSELDQKSLLCFRSPWVK